MSAIHRVTTLSLTLDDWQWPFAIERRNEIDAYFRRLRDANPALWNGRVLLSRHPHFGGDTFSARYFETDFASFIAWRDWGFPDASVVNAPGSGALRGSDGHFVLGEMAEHTANAGRIYFPSGTPDLSDVRDGRVDIPGSVTREVEEETGFAQAVFARCRMALCQYDRHGLADPDPRLSLPGRGIAVADRSKPANANNAGAASRSRHP